MPLARLPKRGGDSWTRFVVIDWMESSIAVGTPRRCSRPKSRKNKRIYLANIFSSDSGKCLDSPYLLREMFIRALDVNLSKITHREELTILQREG
jgi:hypothetical protein